MEAAEHTVRFTSAGQAQLELEGRLHLPAGPGPFPAAVIAHPHPLWGGSMYAEVLIRIAGALTRRGWMALRFNFRGVGSSQGCYDEGRGEIDDLIGALSWLAARKEAHAQRLAVVGYSFGAWVGAKGTIRDARVGAFVGVALPTSEAYRVDLSHFGRPKCFITGARDTLCSPELLRQYVGTLPEPKMLRVLPGADHFLLGSEQDVADQVADFLASSRFMGG